MIAFKNKSRLLCKSCEPAKLQSQTLRIHVYTYLLITFSPILFFKDLTESGLGPVDWMSRVSDFILHTRSSKRTAISMIGNDNRGRITLSPYLTLFCHSVSRNDHLMMKVRRYCKYILILVGLWEWLAHDCTHYNLLIVLYYVRPSDVIGCLRRGPAYYIERYLYISEYLEECH